LLRLPFDPNDARMTASSSLTPAKKFNPDTGAQARSHLAKIASAKGASASSVGKKRAKKKDATGSLDGKEKTTKQPRAPSQSSKGRGGAHDAKQSQEAQGPKKGKTSKQRKEDAQSEATGSNAANGVTTPTAAEGSLDQTKQPKEARPHAVTTAAAAGTEASLKLVAEMCNDKEEAETNAEGTKASRAAAHKRFRLRAPVRIGKAVHRPTRRIMAAATSAAKRGSTIAFSRMRAQAKDAMRDIQQETMSEERRAEVASASAKQLRKLLPVSGIQREALETLRRIMVMFSVNAYYRANLVRYHREKTGISMEDVQLACMDLM